MSTASDNHKRLYKALDKIAEKRGRTIAGRIDLYIHIIMGFHELTEFVHCEECKPQAVDIANELIKKAVILMSNEGIIRDDFKSCYEAAREDYKEFVASMKEASAEAKDVLSRISSDTKH